MASDTLRIFISSPGDVAEERLIARRVIGRLDAQFGDVLHLEAVFWEHQPLTATASFQEQVVRPSRSDIVIAILWSRLGTVLPGRLTRADGSTYASGTEFEFEDAVDGFRRSGKPDIVAYRKTAPAALPADAAQQEEHVHQRRQLDRFLDRWFGNDADGSFRAAFHPFASPADFEDLLEAHLTRLIEPRLPPRSGARPTAAAWRDGSPFRGLAAFEAQHAPVFFGRTGAVASVLMKLRRQAERQRAFVLVVGTSGGGKSSLVRAGVLPLLLQPGVVGHATGWRHAVLRPSDGQGRLDAALDAALLQPTALPALTLADGAAAGPSGPDAASDRRTAASAGAAAVVRALDAVGAETDTGDRRFDLALVVDQLEEMFSDARIGAADRERFVDRLDALARSGRVWLLATLRSDVYPRLAELPVLMKLKQGEGQFDLLPPTLREIGQIIRLPAAAAGLRFEQRASTGERLDETIRDAAAKNLAALPLLQFLLEELYQRRSPEDVLTFRAYDDLGGVEGALARRAEAVLGGVGSEARGALPLVLRELVTFGDDEVRALRRIAPRDAFAAPAAAELVAALLEARLLVSGLDEAGQPTVQLAHEALLGFWPRLREWQERDRELLALKSRLAAAARTWERQHRGGDFLLARGKPLADAQQLVASGVLLAPTERALVAASERRARRFVRLRGGAVTALALLTVVAGIAAYRANVESERARIEATTAQRTTDFMVGLFAVADPEQNRGAALTVREMLDRGVAHIGDGLASEDAVRAKLLLAMGTAYDGLGLTTQARELLLRARALAEPIGGADLLSAHLALGSNRFVEGAHAEAIALYRRAVDEAIRLHGERHPAVSQALCGLGNSLVEVGAAAEAEQHYRRALAIDLALHGEEHADTARTLKALGTLFYAENRHADAEPPLRRALAIYRKLYGDTHAKVAYLLNDLGSLQFQTGRYPAAAATWSEALPIYRAVFGDEHLQVATLLNNLGRVELMRGDTPAARRHLDKALALDRKRLAAGHADLTLPLNSLAMVGMAEGDLDGAGALLDEALAIARANDHWVLDQVLANVADLAARTGRPDRARPALAEARARLAARYGKRLGGDEAWRVAVGDAIAASVEAQQGRFAEAERLLVAALPVLEARFGPRGFYTEQARLRLVGLHESVGRLSDADRERQRLLVGRVKGSVP